MVKFRLDRAAIFAGNPYAPGVHTVDPKVAEDDTFVFLRGIGKLTVMSEPKQAAAAPAAQTKKGK